MLLRQAPHAHNPPISSVCDTPIGQTLHDPPATIQCNTLLRTKTQQVLSSAQPQTHPCACFAQTGSCGCWAIPFRRARYQHHRIGLIQQIVCVWSQGSTPKPAPETDGSGTIGRGEVRKAHHGNWVRNFANIAQTTPSVLPNLMRRPMQNAFGRRVVSLRSKEPRCRVNET